jgi:hypothetical protein
VRGFALGIALGLTLPFGRVWGQRLPFVVPTVDLDRSTMEWLERAYRVEADERERLFCVVSWTRTAANADSEIILITEVRREAVGERHRISDVGERCRGSKGDALPMFHTHSNGNCQASPSDLIAIVARGAPFDGIQCGNRHFVWQFAWQILAIASALEREKLNRTSTPPE